MTSEASDLPNIFVAFCDILGFAERTTSRFDETVTIYRAFGETLHGFEMSDVKLTMYSDSILLTSKALPALLSAVQILWFFALQHNMMIRGAISQGKYWELRKEPHLLVVSDALVRAVKLEAMVSVPAVVVADDIIISDEIWVQRYASGPLTTPLLYFRDRTIVNPFSIYWFRSAKARASMLMEESPRHRDKYLWFLALHQAIEVGSELIPPDVLRRFLDSGIVRFAPNEDKMIP